ncbi:dihydrolipoamide acyltransferase [Chrysochromulina tobinii]|uniref:Dihydrolipoamide acyltransferase n=1 Tax=Chrysochromulina tobinii TaxID=1460289 RepID=A0A0M0JRK0_9EUKA|nr:dihydrolipoamide acyltransferase [Chrysochromulina tobinii]|eukprot:KOO29226.1 dihydrolipoamide acyltransferase [Chrysochromulina sp. CCMP291]
MGDSITEGTLLSLHKKVGDYVAIEELLAMVETDKVTVEAKPVAASAAAALPLSSRFEDGKPSPPGTITFAELPKRFRPKPLSKEEIEAVEMGGAGYTCCLEEHVEQARRPSRVLSP